MSCERQTENDLHEAPDVFVHWVCRRTTAYLGIGIKDTYGFRPKNGTDVNQTELVVDLFQNGKA